MDLPVSEEQPVDLMVNQNRLATFMCTPADLEELAVGHLWGRGAISSIDDVHILGACDEMRIVTVQLAHELPDSLPLDQILSSACGSGGYSEDEELVRRQISSTLNVSGRFLQECFAEMHRRAHMYQDTGGVHSAALIDRSGVLDVKEDVGRHNAIDKALGFCLFRSLKPSDCGLITTGRLSSDMVLKALGAGIGVLATRSIPTSLALEIAETGDLTLIGRGHMRDPHVYAGAHRFLTEQDARHIGSP